MDKEIEKQIEEVSSSAIEFRKSIDVIIFKRLSAVLQTKSKQISRDSKLKSLFDKNVNPADWYELEEIGMRIPELRRNKAFGYLAAVYVLTVIFTWTTFLAKNFESIIVLWGLPLVGPLFIISFSPILLLLLLFKRKNIPVSTVGNLVDRIISENWSDLLADDKKLFKEILREELESRQRTNA
jgi:hypothetical protein